ncbi:GumC family protein [Parasulfitobacter algicola]|uniref:Capsular exopolysaccharide family n=1 Tax=Parasulfitobacter algicola TaxID=2614809 RepID=A0ABX2IKY2_9RHOB|nr:Wzz/FepE/Etk N-terminal domain-containing protein [Sulfitobacter algicola]NSX53522.1 hypothetical protein [Sulfitobacter algicola]
MQDTDLTLKDVIGIAKRQFRLILLTVFLCLTLTLVYLFSVTPKYRATALVLIDPVQRNVLDPRQQASVAGSTENARVESEVEILRSAATALATIEKIGLIADPEFGPRLSLTDKLKQSVGVAPSNGQTGIALVQDTLSKFRNAITVKRRGLTYLIAVSVDAENPDRAASLANAVAETYIDRQLQAKIASSFRARDILKEQTDRASENLTQTEDALDAFIVENLDQFTAESSAQALRELQIQLDQANKNRLQAKARADRVQIARETGNWDSFSETLGNTALQSLAAERAELQRRLSQITTNTAENVNLRAEIRKIEETLDKNVAESLNGLRDEIAQFDRDADKYTDQIRQSVLQGQMSSQMVTRVFSLQQEAAIARNQYQALLSRLRDLEAQATAQIADSRIVSEALPPRSAGSPQKTKILVLAFAVAIGLGIGLAFLNEYYIGGITSAAQLRNITQASRVTSIPAIGGSGLAADQIIDVPLSAYSEAVRRLRSEIDITTGKTETRGKVVLVASAIPSEGKSTTALALARTYAMSGKDVLLIDCDLRKPSLHTQLNMSPDSGFLDYLQNPMPSGAEQPSFYDRDPRSDAAVIMGAGGSDIPTDQLLASNVFDKLIRDARNVVDVIILDTAPLLSVVDTRYIAHHADIAVMSVRFGQTPQADVRTAMAELKQLVKKDVPIINVLNLEQTSKDRRRLQGYYVDA